MKTKPEIAAEMPPPAAVRLMSKHEVCAIVGVSYPSIWLWMREGKFPRSRVVVGQSKWLSTDIEEWMAQLPVRRLKGDAANVDHAA